MEWPCQEQRRSGLTASAPVWDFSARAYTTGVWLLPRLVACACGAEEQTVYCCPSLPNPSTSHNEAHGLTVLDDKTIELLLNPFPGIYCGLAVD